MLCLVSQVTPRHLLTNTTRTTHSSLRINKILQCPIKARPNKHQAGYEYSDWRLARYSQV